MAVVQKAKLLLKPGYPLGHLGLSGAGGTSNPIDNLQVGSRYGIVFQYTPTINVNGSATYNQIATPHNNYQANIFEMSMPAQFNVAWQMTAQTTEEADYMLGCMHFMRMMTKAHFGEPDPFAGTPPPVLEFSAYGQYQFNAVPVVVRSYTYDMNSEVDFVQTSYATQVPTFLQGFLDVAVQVTPDRTRKEFSFRGLADGSLLGRGGFI